MQLGFFTMPVHPIAKDWRQSLREDREAFILADELGFSEGYVGEHATDKAENITSCAMFLATLADATKKIRLGTGTVNLPNSHPVAVASQIAMLDHLLDGRLIFGISPGGLLSDAEVFGNLGADRNAMFVEAIGQVLAIWAGEPPYDITPRTRPSRACATRSTSQCRPMRRASRWSATGTRSACAPRSRVTSCSRTSSSTTTPS
jgi:alkanesulfonate monooxygenase SsuD/methylene tetrahydromethanopterin reductase-like flavin-dependent oxidoreductase (luciferase family)